MNQTRYQIEDVDQIISPSLVVFRETLEENLAEMVSIAGDPARLRPHCKTHKMSQVVELQLALGITRHKCATFAEAEMLVAAGVDDILLAYNLVGPNLRGSGVKYDVRTDEPYSVYPEFDFEVPVGDGRMGAVGD